MPYKGGVQLLPETRQQAVKRAVSGNRWVYWGLGIAAVVLVVNIILSSYIQNLTERIAVQDGQLRTQEQSRDKDVERELLEAQKQSRLMGQLLASHLYWTQALGLIGDLMQSGVRFTSLTADAAGTVEFTATAASYATVARQIASFTAGEGVQNVEVGSVQSNEGIIEFSGIITLNVGQALRKQVATPTPTSTP